jgi:3-methyladenine DNA glycosylase AlkD
MKSTTTRTHLEKQLKAAANPERAASSVRFFKTGKGQYAEGDIFLGISTPILRKIAREHQDLSLADIKILLESKLHEYRVAALEILAEQFKRANDKQRKQIVKFYLANTSRINNWDLVDASARPILGEHLKTHRRAILTKLSRSKSLWERRISIISTLAFVRDNDLDDAFRIAKSLLADNHDLMHKAIGWVLREAGSKDRKRLLKFIEENYSNIPRTTLRYAIEHFLPDQRKRILSGDFQFTN